MVWSPGWVVSNVDTIDEPQSPYKRLIDIVSQASQFVMWDRRGTGSPSDPAGDVLTFDDRVDDLRAVIDAVGAERPVLLGSSEGGSICILFAARYPERLSPCLPYTRRQHGSPRISPTFPGASVLLKSKRRSTRSIVTGAKAHSPICSTDRQPTRPGCGTCSASCNVRSPVRRWPSCDGGHSWTSTCGVCSFRCIRSPWCSPGQAHQFVPIEAAQALAAALPNSRFERLPAGSHNGFDVLDELCDAVLKFVGNSPSRPADERVLKTVMFTDIVGSTERLSAQGDSRWRHQLDNHDNLVDHIVATYGGDRANHTRGWHICLVRCTYQGSSLRARPAACTCRARYSDPDRHPHRRMRAARSGVERTRCAHRRPDRCVGGSRRSTREQDGA